MRFAAAQEGALAWFGGGEEARFRSSVPRRPYHKAHGLSEPHPRQGQLDSYIHNQVLRRGSGELPSRGTHLFCRLPEGHSRKRGAPGGCPPWPLAPEPPLPATTAGPSPRLCGPASGPGEMERNPTGSHGAVVGGTRVAARTTGSQPHTLNMLHGYTHIHSSSCHSRLPPCGAGGQQAERRARERSPQHDMIPRTCVQSPERLKASYERQAPVQRFSSTFSPWEVRGLERALCCLHSLGITFQAHLKSRSVQRLAQRRLSVRGKRRLWGDPWSPREGRMQRGPRALRVGSLQGHKLECRKPKMVDLTHVAAKTGRAGVTGDRCQHLPAGT